MRSCAKTVKLLNEIASVYVSEGFPERACATEREKSYALPAEIRSDMGFSLTLFGAQVFIVLALAYRPFLQTRNSMSVVGCKGVYDPRD